MKKRLDKSKLLLIFAAATTSFLTGCASMEANKTDPLLSQAGFRTRTPETAEQKEVFASLPSNKIEHATVKGKSFYVFKDEKTGVAYVGGHREHQRYKELCAKQHAAQAAEEEMNPSLATKWSNQWGPQRD